MASFAPMIGLDSNGFADINQACTLIQQSDANQHITISNHSLTVCPMFHEEAKEISNLVHRYWHTTLQVCKTEFRFSSCIASHQLSQGNSIG